MPAPAPAPPACPCSARVSVRSVVMANGKKVDVSKQGLNSIKNPTVQLNLMGRSKTMQDKNFVDPQGRKGKVGPAVGQGAGCRWRTHVHSVPCLLLAGLSF